MKSEGRYLILVDNEGNIKHRGFFRDDLLSYIDKEFYPADDIKEKWESCGS